MIVSGHYCIRNEMEPCFACKDGYIYECQIEFFRKMMIRERDIKEYILRVFYNKDLVMIYGKENVKYMHKAIELYLPQHLELFNKLSILF
jgi:hypothetical protein